MSNQKSLFTYFEPKLGNIICTIQSNPHCIKCNCVDKEYVQVGAFCMCRHCFHRKFNSVNSIKRDSGLFEIYKHWLKIYFEE